MAQIPRNIRRDPKFIYLQEWFSDEEAAYIVANKIPLNHPGVVPSVQVPPGAKGCQGLGVVSLLDVAGDIQAPVIGYDPGAVWRTMPLQTMGTTALNPGGSSPGSSYPAQTRELTFGGWAEDNFGMLLALMGGVAAFALVSK